MLGRGRAPVGRAPDMYAARASAAESVYNADSSVKLESVDFSRNPMHSSNYSVPSTAPKLRAFFKSNMWRMDGIINNWAWGATDQGAHTASLPYGGGMDGTVRSTNYQRILVQLHDWQLNRKWYVCWNGNGGGVFSNSNPLRYEYPSFRVPQINVSLTGGPGVPTQRMQSTPRYTAVQKVQKYTANPRYYNTTSQGQTGYGLKRRNASSSTYGPGI
jgi:hypothetical protein